MVIIWCCDICVKYVANVLVLVFGQCFVDQPTRCTMQAIYLHDLCVLRMFSYVCVHCWLHLTFAVYGLL